MSLNTSELVEHMEEALKEEYSAQKNKDLSDLCKEDRELLFTAIARGVLRYLESKEKEFISEITLRYVNSQATYTYEVKDLKLEITP